jgi:acyl-coenzyme A synthetase/AMP-(fatty) acid ligase
MHVVDMVFFWAKAEPHRSALVQPEMVTTFRGLADAIEAIGDRIDRLNLDTGEPVAVSITNPTFALATMFALLRCGFSVAPVNRPLYFHLKSAGIRNLIYDTDGQVMSGGRNIRFDASWLPAASPAQSKPYRQRPAGNGDMVFFTSGTTGRPKAFVQAMGGLSDRFGSPLTCANGDHRKALILPGLTGAFGFNRTCEMLYAGKTACLSPFGEAALLLISVFGIEVAVASPQQFLSLADLQAKTARYDLSSLKALRIGGAMLSREAARRIRSHLCRSIIVSYASTEAGIAAIAPYEMIADIPGAVGFLTPSTEVEIVDQAGAVMPPGSEGIIRVRTAQYAANFGPSDVRVGNADKPWFYPGDVGHVTDDGVLCLAGRSSDVINRGGAKVSAGRIEEILEALPEIKEAAACGVETGAGLEEVWIAVVPQAQASIDAVDIKRRLKEHDDVGFTVDEVFALEQLPRNDLGKVQKHKLKDVLLALKKAGA